MTRDLPVVYSSFSPDFVSPLFPSPGEDIKLSVAFSFTPESVILKYDSQTGLVFNKDMAPDGTFNDMEKYSATVPVTTDGTLFRYYFAFFVDGASYYYSRLGITRYTPSLSDRFSLIVEDRVPEWVAESTCYQVFPDRFNNADPSLGAKEGEYEFDGGAVTTPAWTDEPKDWNESRCCDFYNGDLKGIEEKASYFRSLGVNALYINPVFSSQSVHRYDTIDFFSVDPKLGGDEALISLVRTMHENGIRVILDISINHTGLAAVWLKKALENPQSEERGFYYFNPDGTFSCWQDVKTLPQLNYSDSELRKIMYEGASSVMKKYLTEPFSIDGWRLDVAPEVGRRGSDQLTYSIWRGVNSSLRAVKDNLYIVGEDWDDSALYLEGDMWNGTMNYYGAGRPLRSWMGERDRFLLSGYGHSPLSDLPWNGYELAGALRSAIQSVPLQTPYMQMNLFDSHDTPRLHNNSKVFNRDIYKGVIMALYFLPGMPSTYYGDEVLLNGKIDSNEGARYPMEWREDHIDYDMLSFFRKMGELRNSDRDLFYAATEISAIDEGASMIARIKDKKAYVAVINKGEKREVTIGLSLLPKGKASLLYGEGKVRIEGSSLSLSLDEKKSLLILLEN